MLELIARARILSHFFEKTNVRKKNAFEFSEIKEMDYDWNRQRKKRKEEVRIDEFHSKVKGKEKGAGRRAVGVKKCEGKKELEPRTKSQDRLRLAQN